MLNAEVVWVLKRMLKHIATKYFGFSATYVRQIVSISLVCF